MPKFSVVIPAYNQARYLAGAVESVLKQTYCDFEAIVVDDGSTDDTPTVAQRFGPRLRYIRQENRGLAGARNTGIRAARGEYIGLLDSDDQWEPVFLETMISLAARVPNAAVYCCSSRCIDAHGMELPQRLTPFTEARDSQYMALLRGNSLIPSAVVIRRSTVLEAGLFDERLRRIEDWDLWLRLLKQGHFFASSAECLVRYRLHGSSLSANPEEMQRTVSAVVEKHFGQDDGRWNDWSKEKRRAYGGAFRYNAITSLTRAGDWKECAHYLSVALHVDPTLAVDIDLFYELALGTQPLGYRGTPYQLKVEENARRVTDVLMDIFNSQCDRELSLLRCTTYGTAYYALGLVAYDIAQLTVSRQFLFTALRFRHDLLRDRRVVGDLLKSFIGYPARTWLGKSRDELIR